MNKKVIYTALFGERGTLNEPAYVPKGWDFVCFTDRDDLSSQVWDIKKVKAQYSDNPRKSAKVYKILPHVYVGKYDWSLWIDANLILRGDINELFDTYADALFVTFSHAYNVHDSRDCIYEELESLLEMNRRGRRRDNDEVMINQVEGYRTEGYPEHNGLIVGMFLLRQHNHPLVKKTMEDWWKEIKTKSIRDQLSCNYVAWKNKLFITFINEDSRDNEYVKYVPHQNVSFLKKIFQKCKNFLIFN